MSSRASDTYTEVVRNEVWPWASCMTPRFVPFLTMWVANVWRNVWTLAPLMVLSAIPFVACGGGFASDDDTPDSKPAAAEDDEKLLKRALGSGFVTNFEQVLVPLEEIVSGGPSKDGIPAIDEPKFLDLAGGDERPGGRTVDLPPGELHLLGAVQGQLPAGTRALHGHRLPTDRAARIPTRATTASTPAPSSSGNRPMTACCPCMERVATVSLNGEDVAYPFSVLEPVVVFFAPGTVSALDRASIADSPDVGSTGVFSPVLDGRTLTFRLEGGRIVDEETGSTWNVLGLATDGPLEGQELTPVAHGDHFWFAWGIFKPNTRICPGGRGHRPPYLWLQTADRGHAPRIRAAYDGGLSPVTIRTQSQPRTPGTAVSAGRMRVSPSRIAAN